MSAPRGALGPRRGFLLRAVLGLVLAGAFVLPPATARAGTTNGAEAEAAAAAHFDQGRHYFDLGDYDAAVKEFLAAYHLKPHPDVLINIAFAYERIYKPSEARRYYEMYLRQTRDDSAEESPLRRMAEKRLRVLTTLPGSILVTANHPGATVTLRGKGLEKSGLAPMRFDDLPPGDYRVHVALADHVPVDEAVHLEPGEAHVANVRLEHQVEALTVFSRPSNARVFVDDHELGRTPFSRPLEVGRNRILRLELPGFPAHVEAFDLLAGQPVQRRITFKHPRRSGRTELLLAMMAYGGFAAGSLTVAVAGSSFSRVTVGEGLGILIPTTVAGIGVGFLGAWALTDENTKVGHSSIIIGGTFLGTGLGAALSFGLGLDRPPAGSTERNNYPNTLGVSILGGALGMGAGILSAWLWDPSAGDAAMVNSGGMWGGLTGLLLGEAIDFPTNAPSYAPEKGMAWLSLGGSVLGIAGGALFAHYLEESRAQVAIVDAAGALGLALGGGVGYAAGHDGSGGSSGLCGGGTRCVSAARYGLGGMAIGLVAGALITRRFKNRLPPQEALLDFDLRPGRRARPTLGLPRVQLTLAQAPEGPDRRLMLELASGRF